MYVIKRQWQGWHKIPCEWLVNFNWIDDRHKQGWNLNANHPEDYNFNTDSQFLFRYSVSFFPARGSFIELINNAQFPSANLSADFFYHYPQFCIGFIFHEACFPSKLKKKPQRINEDVAFLKQDYFLLELSVSCFAEELQLIKKQFINSSAYPKSLNARYISADGNPCLVGGSCVLNNT